MKRKKMMMGGAAMLALFLTVGVSDVLGQQGRRPPGTPPGDALTRRAGAPGAPGLEGILRMKDRLELSEEQVARLDALRSEQVERRAQDGAASSELRSALRAGTVERAEARERMLALREERRATAEESRAAVEEILDAAQLAEIEQMQAQRRAFQAGRRSGIRERGRASDRPARPGRDSPRRGARGGI